MKYEMTVTPQGPVLVLHDQLTFADRDAFDAVIDRLLAKAGPVATVDLERVTYMDSAGLGMLLTLRDRAERAGVEARLVRPRGDVKELLVLACFDSLFTIES